MATALTGGEVVSAIATKLKAGFSTDEAKKLYKDKPAQGMVKPCFFIHQLNHDTTAEMKDRAQKDYLIDIRYHPSDADTEAFTTMGMIQEKLCSVVDEITVVSQSVKAKSLKSQIVDGVLHTIVSYSFKVVKQPVEYPLMETVEITERVN